MTDSTYQSVFFAYLLFGVFAAGAVYFFVRSVKDGYLGPNSEEPKYRMLEDDPLFDEQKANSHCTPRRP